MKDKYEEYFRENRDQLDLKEPNVQSIWYGIEHHFKGKNQAKQLQWWRIAAIFLAMISVTQLTYILSGNRSSNMESVLLAQSDRGAFEQLEASYRQELVMLERRLSAKDVSPENYPVFFEEMSYIDQVEDEFKKEIPLAHNREKLAGILIDTYEKKIQLLERLLQQVERNEKQKEDEVLMPIRTKDKTMAI